MWEQRPCQQCQANSWNSYGFWWWAEKSWTLANFDRNWNADSLWCLMPHGGNPNPNPNLRSKLRFFYLYISFFFRKKVSKPIWIFEQPKRLNIFIFYLSVSSYANWRLWPSGKAHKILMEGADNEGYICLSIDVSLLFPCLWHDNTLSIVHHTKATKTNIWIKSICIYSGVLKCWKLY